MKKLFLIFLVVLFPVYLFGVELSVEYKDGFDAYKSKNFKKSYKIFSKLYLTKLSDAKVNFYLGRSAYETGHYEVALAAFERVEMLENGNLRNKLEMARTYFMLKMYKDSQNAFEEVLANPNIPQNVRTNIEIYLAKIKGVQKKSFTYATFDVDWVYDSNVNYGSLDSNYNINTGSVTAEKEHSDRALQVYGDVVNIYDIGDKNGFAIKNRVKLFLKDYRKLNDYDVQFLAYDPSILYKEMKYLAEFVVGLDVMTLGKEEYLRRVSFIPRFEYSHTTNLKSMLSFKYQTKYFTPKAQSDFDSHHYELGYALQDIMSASSYSQVNLIGLREKKDHGSNVQVDYDEYKLNLKYANQFTYIYGGEIFGEYRIRNYDDYDPTYSSKRKDDAVFLAASINARILKTFRLHLKGTYNRVNSNQEKYAYEKYTVIAGVNKTF